MPKPSEVPTWATGPNATSDPGPTRRETGFIAGKKLPAKWLNWILSRQAAWFTYLRDLHTEPEFLNKAYAWTGLHRFDRHVTAADLRWTVPPKRRIYLDLLSGVDVSSRFWTGMMAMAPSWILSEPGPFSSDPQSGLLGHILWTDKAAKIMRFALPIPVPSRLLEVNICMKTGGGNAAARIFGATASPFGGYPDVSPAEGPLPIASQLPVGTKTTTAFADTHTLRFDMTKTEAGSNYEVMGAPHYLFWLDIESSNMNGARPGNFETSAKYDLIYWIELVVEEYGPTRVG